MRESQTQRERGGGGAERNEVNARLRVERESQDRETVG